MFIHDFITTVRWLGHGLRRTRNTSTVHGDGAVHIKYLYTIETEQRWGVGYSSLDLFVCFNDSPGRCVWNIKPTKIMYIIWSSSLNRHVNGSRVTIKMQNIVLQQSRGSKPTRCRAVYNGKDKKKLVGNFATENEVENNNETKRVKIKYKNWARGHAWTGDPIMKSLFLRGLPGTWARSTGRGRIRLEHRST